MRAMYELVLVVQQELNMLMEQVLHAGGGLRINAARECRNRAGHHPQLRGSSQYTFVIRRTRFLLPVVSWSYIGTLCG